MMIKKSFSFLAILLIVVLNACTSIEKKREITIALLDYTKDSTDIEFDADKFSENSLSYVDDEILEYMANNEKFANLKNLNIYNLNNITGNGLKHLLKFKKLRYLYLTGSETMTDTALQILSKLDTLTSLDIHNFDNIENLKLHHFKCLEKIDIEECKNLKNADFEDIPNCKYIQFWKCPQLTAQSSVKISNCNKPSVFYCRCWNLEKVNIVTNDSICKVSVWNSALAANGLSKIKNIKGIEVIDLSTIKTDSLVVPAFPDLEKLIYNDDGERDDTTLLSKLIILNSPRLSDISIRTNSLRELIIDTIPSLKSLDFSHFRNYNLDKLQLLKFKNLERLRIRGHENGKVLESISQLPKINDLELRIGELTSQYIKKLAENEMLKSLKLRDIPDNESLACLFQSKSLKRIDIGGSKNISEVVIENNNQLESFRAYSSDGIKKVYINNCKKLSSLDMQMCYPTDLFISGADSLFFIRVALNNVKNLDKVFQQINECEHLFSLFLEMPVTDKELDLSNLKDLYQLNFGMTKTRYVKKLILNKKLEGESNEFYGYDGPIEYK